MSTVFQYEKLMTAPVCRHLQRHGVRNIMEEVAFYEYRVDLYGYASRTKTTYAIELKLTKWRRAFEQALAYQLCADLVWLAMPLSNANRVDHDLLVEHGIGLIGVQHRNRCIRLIEAKQSVFVNMSYRNHYAALLTGPLHANSTA